MKIRIKAVCAVLLAAAISLTAGEQAQQKPTSPEFEKLKSLVGTWQGKVDIGQGPADMKVQYRVIAGGTVLEERVFPGTQNEMVTMYYEKDGKVALTHYCIMGNRPAMVLKSADSNSLTFDFDPTCGINPSKESHMHGLTIQFVDADTIETRCKAMIGGKETEPSPTKLKRIKAS